MRWGLTILALFCASGFAATVRVSCGGPGGVDPQGNVWTPIAGGYPYTVPGQTLPYSSLCFSDPAGAIVALTVTPPSTVGTVTLKFIEPSKTAAGQRRFSVAINGVQVVTNLDLFAAAGMLKPYDVTFPFSGSPIVITLTPTTAIDKAVISGIQVDTVDPPGPWPYPHVVTGLETAPPPCPSTGMTFFFATDTQHLFWCSMLGDGIWHTVGDVRNFVSPPPAGLIALETCSGSGSTGIDGIGWNCAAIYHATIGLQDGTQISLIGPDMPMPSATGITWTSVK